MTCAQGQIAFTNNWIGISQQQFALPNLKESIENHFIIIVA